MAPILLHRSIPSSLLYPHSSRKSHVIYAPRCYVAVRSRHRGGTHAGAFTILQSPRTAYLTGLLALGIVLLWVLPLWSSLWIDETITYWVIKDGLPALFRRSLLYNAQSPFYFLIAWTAVAIGGAKEWVLRLPSVLATSASTVLVYHLGRRFGDHEMGALAAVCFATYWLVVDAARTARGYAVALMVVIAAIAILERWLEQRRCVDWVAYVALSVLTVYLQPLFGVMFLVHVVYVAQRVRGGTTIVGWPSVVATAAATGLLLLPLILSLQPVWQRRMSMSVVSGAQFPGWGDARFALMPIAVIIGSLLLGRRVAAYYKPLPAPLLLLACWSAIPVLFILMTARWVSATVLVSRYFLCAAPGIALVMAWGVRGVRKPRVRLVLVTVIAGMSVVFMGISVEQLHDWRAALRAATSVMNGEPHPVLVDAGSVEAARLRWPLDPEDASYLVSPVAFYPVPGPAFPLPYDLDAAGVAYLRQLSAALAEKGGPFALVVDTDRFFGGRPVPFREWLDDALRPTGLASRQIGRFGTISVVVFDKVH